MESRIDGRSLRYQHRRGELLEAIAEYVLENGVATLSLRRVADAVGVSHVTLQHHFGSKEQLVGEIVEHVLGKTLGTEGSHINGAHGYSVDFATRLRGLWTHLTSPSGLRDLRLFIEVFGQSLYGEVGYSEAVARAVAYRLEFITATVVSLGCPQEEAKTFATLLLATLRGLVIELQVTGDRERLEQAFAMVVADAELRSARWA
jgi:AcrR family transcriptional regulator